MPIKSPQLEIPFTAADKNKLDGVTSGAEVNPSVANQQIAEAGVDNSAYMTALRVKQAIAVFASSAGEANTASNLGAGTGEVFSSKSALDLRFRSLVAGTNVTITQDANEITINASGGSGAVDSVNSQTGTVVLDADDISDAATTNKFTTAGDISKLAGISAGAEVNPDLVSQAEAEAGTATIERTWTAQRVKQAIDALAPAGGGADLEVENSGTSVDTAVVNLNFTGAGVTASQTSAGVVEVNVPGGGGSNLFNEYTFSLSAASTIAARTATGLPVGWSAVAGDNGSVDAELSGNADDLVIIHGENKDVIEFTVIKVDESTPLGGSKRFKIDSSGSPNERVVTNTAKTQSRFKNFQLDVGNFPAVIYVRLL